MVVVPAPLDVTDDVVSDALGVIHVVMCTVVVVAPGSSDDWEGGETLVLDAAEA